MSEQFTVIASADHVAPQYRFFAQPFAVRRDADGLYVTAPGFGCSRTYRNVDAAGAVKLFLAEQGNRLVMVHSIEEVR